MFSSRQLEPEVDIVCLSHLRWDFVFQRPQHLLTRAAQRHRVFFVEEPITSADVSVPALELRRSSGVTVAVPSLPASLSPAETIAAQRTLLDELLRSSRITNYLLWYYTPMALLFSEHLDPRGIVYDCMDELSGFKGAPTDLKGLEKRLLARADVVFTGGRSLFEAKRQAHPNIHAMPSSVDVAHFGRARTWADEPADQASIPRPRLGFFGVIDERMDLPLVEGVAITRPDWQLVFVGPLAKIDAASLPRRRNIHYLGGKTYDALPGYVAGWDVALLPFARNDATRFISPTKTPEYLAAGRPVVSTPIDDVVVPYGELELAHIADDVPSFVAACARAMAEPVRPRLRRADRFLRQTSWDATWARMYALVAAAVEGHAADASLTTAPSLHGDAGGLNV